MSEPSSTAVAVAVMTVLAFAVIGLIAFLVLVARAVPGVCT